MLVTDVCAYGVDMTYLVTRAFSGPHDEDMAVHALSLS